jgi:hypothetical protein
MSATTTVAPVVAIAASTVSDLCICTDPHCGREHPVYTRRPGHQAVSRDIGLSDAIKRLTFDMDEDEEVEAPPTTPNIA